MQNLHADARERLQLLIAQLLHLRRALHERGIGRQHARHIRPVFVQIRVQRRRGQRTGHVGAAARERMDLAVRQRAVEPRRHDLPPVGERAQRGIGRSRAHAARRVEQQPVFRVDEVEAQQVRHQPRREIFAPRDDPVPRRAAVHGGVDRLELRLDGQRQRAAVADLAVAVGDSAPQVPAAHLILQVRMAEIQKIRDLMVGRVPPARGRHHDHPPRRVGQHDLAHARKARAVAQRRAAEFGHFQHELPSFRE